MFWKGTTSSSQVDAILAKEDITLQQLMDEEDIINECKVQNKPLLDFLTKPEIIEELVTLTTIEPSPKLDERTRFKYSNIACEILTCDVPALNERLASDEALLSKLYVFLDNEPPLNPLLASFFSKIMGVLIAKKTEQVLDFLKAKENFVSILLKHLGTSAIMDLTLKLMTQVECVEIRQNVLNWLNNQRIIQLLVSLMNPNVDKERHFNVAQLLCDFIKISRDTQKNLSERNDPDPLLNTLESLETVSLLLENMLSEDKTESCIVGGIQVLLALLDVNKVSCDESNDVEQKQTVVENTILAVLKRLKDFHGLLLDPPKKNPISSTVGTLDPPLGNTRLQVTKLFATLISTNNPEVLNELISLGTMQVLLDLFFAFPWNNFLHTQVQACITSALKAHIPSETGDNNALLIHLLDNCKLLERILEGWKNNDEKQKESKGARQGYMGHLIDIADTVVDLCLKTPLGQYVKVNFPEVFKSFEDFYNYTLYDVKKTQRILLGGVPPNTSNEGSCEYGDILFQQSNLMHQQMYTQYQLYPFTTQYEESYGFNDDDFDEDDPVLQEIDRRTEMNFGLSENDLVQQQELFKQVCAQNINTLDDADDQIFEERELTFQTIVEKPGERHDAVYSSDSDEDDEDSPPSEDPFMDLDPWSSSQKTSESAIAPVSVEDPWNSNISEKPAEEASTGWANFSSPSFANFEANFDNLDNNNKNKVATDKSAAESDLKIENVEVDNSSKIDEEQTKKNLNNESIENVAQVVVKKEQEACNDDNINVNDDKINVNDDKINVNDDKINVNDDNINVNEDNINVNDDQGRDVTNTKLPTEDDKQPSKSAAISEEDSTKKQETTGSTTTTQVRSVNSEPDQKEDM